MKESPVFVKMFDFVTWVIPLTVKFPREQRFVVADALQRATLSSQEALIRAVHAASPAATLDHLGEAATQLALVRLYLRLSERLFFITVKQYEYAAERLSELGRLVRAWQRSCQAKVMASNTTAVSSVSSS